MDSDSIGDRLKDLQISNGDNVENANNSMEEEVPKILNPAIRDVFRMFVNMLDINSFIKLAMTSKEMYRQCMEIRYNINVEEIKVWNRNGSMEFLFPFLDMMRPTHDSFVASLRKITCKLNVLTLEMDEYDKSAVGLESNAYSFLMEIGVNKIDELILKHPVAEWDTIITIIKDYDVKSVSVHRPIENDILRSILQLNLEKFCYHHDLVPLNFILGVDSPIREISFPELYNISDEELKKFLLKMKSGSLRRLTVAANAINFRNFVELPFDYEGPLPYSRNRFLLLVRTPRFKHHEYWYLNQDDGDIAKFGEIGDTYALQISQCKPCEYPYILRKEEDVLKDLTEKRPRVSCSAAQFRTFSTNFTMINRFYEGPLPETRPLYCKVTENDFWMLDENDELMKCTWEDGCAIWKAFATRNDEHIDHPALAKYVFWKFLKQANRETHFNIRCNGQEEFDSWFKDIQKLDFEYSGVLPNVRPLFFEKASTETEERLIRIVLLAEDRLIECDTDCFDVGIHHCYQFDRPPMFFTAENVMEMLIYPGCANVHFNISFDVFSDGLKMYKKSQKMLLITDGESDFWYQMNGTIRKVEWKEGRLSISECELRESPHSFMKQVFKYFAEECCSFPVELNLEQFNSCLKQFTVVPYDYSGPLTSDSPMAFVKREIRESWILSFRVWFLWNTKLVTYCSWEQCFGYTVEFNSYAVDVPPILKSKEYLKILLLQTKYDKLSNFQWIGRLDDFYDYLNDYMKLPFDYDGPLPEERPLLFEGTSDNVHPICFLLREDGCIIRVQWESYASLSLSTFQYSLPSALKSML